MQKIKKIKREREREKKGKRKRKEKEIEQIYFIRNVVESKYSNLNTFFPPFLLLFLSLQLDLIREMRIRNYYLIGK